MSPADPGDARLDAMLTRWFEENVDLSPEYATNLGLDRGARAALSGQLRQAGIADAEADRVRARARWAEIRTVSEEGLSDQAKVSLAVYRFTAEGAATGGGHPLRRRHRPLCRDAAVRGLFLRAGLHGQPAPA
jgi:uncharacterized protein (DUF885 family)